jgi:hypothetical protein
MFWDTEIFNSIELWELININYALHRALILKVLLDGFFLEQHRTEI